MFQDDVTRPALGLVVLVLALVVAKLLIVHVGGVVAYLERVTR